MKKGTVSIIVPVYNVGEYLRKCAESILNQTYNNLELVLVDDKSTDNSLEICNDIAKSDSRVKVFALPKNSGAAKARIVGINKAMGEYITFVDGDDYILKDTLEILVNALNENDLDIIQCGLTKTYDYDMPKKSNNCKDVRVYDAKNAIYQLYGQDEKSEFSFLLCTKLFRAKLFLGLPLPEDNLKINDAPVIPRVFSRANKIGVCDTVFYYYVMRKSDGNKSTMDIVNDDYFIKTSQHLLAYKTISDYFMDKNNELYALTYKYTLVYALSVLKSGAKDKEIKSLAKKVIKSAPKDTVLMLPLKKRLVCKLFKTF